MTPADMFFSLWKLNSSQIFEEEALPTFLLSLASFTKTMNMNEGSSLEFYLKEFEKNNK